MIKTNIKLFIGFLFLIMLSSTLGSADLYGSSSYSDNSLSIMFLIISIYIIVFIVWIAVAIWVYTDAKKRGENAVLWLIIIIFGGLIGVLIWFAFRPPIGGRKSIPSRICPNCGREIPFDANLCSYCGKKFEIFL